MCCRTGDDEGRAIQRYLDDWGVKHAPSPAPSAATRVNIVACDSAGNRTWFSGLRGIASELAEADLLRVAPTPVAYIDCYEVLGDAPRSGQRRWEKTRQPPNLRCGKCSIRR